jgi:hypothetical protein
MLGTAAGLKPTRGEKGESREPSRVRPGIAGRLFFFMAILKPIKLWDFYLISIIYFSVIVLA